MGYNRLQGPFLSNSLITPFVSRRVGAIQDFFMQLCQDNLLVGAGIKNARHLGRACSTPEPRVNSSMIKIWQVFPPTIIPNPH